MFAEQSSACPSESDTLFYEPASFTTIYYRWSDILNRRNLLALSALAIVVLMTWMPVSVGYDSEYDTAYRVNLYGNGSAAWIIEQRIELKTQTEVDDFSNTIAEVSGNESEMSFFSDRINSAVNDAVTATGRSMNASDFRISASIDDTITGRYGVVEYSFRWSNFARICDNGSLLIGDVLTSGLYLPENSLLIIQIPDGYDAASVSPQPDSGENNALIWSGRRYLDSGEPSILVQQSSITGIPQSYLTAGLTVLALIILIYGALAFRRKRATAGMKIESRPEKDEGAKPVGGVSTDERGMPADVDSIEEMLKRDEDRVVELLRSRGGVMYQSDIVLEMGFSKSKTSMLINNLKDEGIIEKIMKGRRNLIRLKENAKK